MIIERSIDISAPPERIWQVISDVARWPDWTPTVTSVELLDSGSFRVGTRVRIRQPRLPTAVWTVSAIDPRRSFTWESVTTGLRSVADHRVDVRGTSSTNSVTLRLEWTGWLTPLIRLLFGKLSTRYVETEAQSLKRYCEASSR